ncbi:hypothetical protein ABPG72_011419 [Tetrahymena utriculariae]
MKPNMPIQGDFHQFPPNMIPTNCQFQQIVSNIPVPQAQGAMYNIANPQQPIYTKNIYQTQPIQKRQEKPKEKQNFQQEKYYKDKPADFKYLYSHGYYVNKELGRGGYGVVYKAYEYRDTILNKKKKFAIKINFQTVSPELIFSEIAFLTLLKGQPCTPQMVDLFTQEEKTHIVIEYFKYEPFIKFFAESNMEEIKHYIYQMLLAVKTLKSMGIYHRDVKPGNFLYNTAEKKGILIDYGLSEIDDKFIENLKEQQRQKKDPEIEKKIQLYQNIKKCEKIVGKNKIGTESFMPLESILRYRDQGYQVDIWPIGVVFLQFLLKKYNIFNNVRMQNKPNQNKNNHNKSGQIKNTYFITFILELANIFGSDAVIELCRKYEYEVSLPNELPKGPINFKEIIKKEEFDDVANDLLTKLIALDQADRISVEDALNHPFFDSIRDYEAKKQQQQLQNQQLFQQQQQQSIHKNQLIQISPDQIPQAQQPIQQMPKKSLSSQNPMVQQVPVGAQIQNNPPIINSYQPFINYANPTIQILTPLYNQPPFPIQQAAAISSIGNHTNYTAFANSSKNGLNIQPPK